MRPFSFLFLLGLALPSGVFADTTGWNIGAGLASSDILNDQASTPPFPYIRTDQKQVMLIPSVQYQTQQWSFGIDGIGWQSKDNDRWQWDVKAGFPASYLSGSGQRGWFRYGAKSELASRNGWVHTGELTVGPIKYALATGLGDRSNDVSHAASFGAPLYINQAHGITVIGNVGLQWDNASFLQNDYEIETALSETTYRHTVASAIAIWRASEQITVLLNGKLQWNDERFVDEVEGVSAVSANTFLLFSYAFGR